MFDDTGLGQAMENAANRERANKAIENNEQLASRILVCELAILELHKRILWLMSLKDEKE